MVAFSTAAERREINDSGDIELAIVERKNYFNSKIPSFDMGLSITCKTCLKSFYIKNPHGF